MRKVNTRKKISLSTMTSYTNLLSVRTPRLLAIAKLSLTFTLRLSPEFLQTHRNFFNLTTRISDLTFIAESPEIADKITLSSNINSSNFFLFMNKATVNKTYIEVISLSQVNLCSEAMYLKEPLMKIIEKNNILINDNSNYTELRQISNEAEITLILKGDNNEQKVFVLTSKNEKQSKIIDQSAISKSHMNTFASMSPYQNSMFESNEIYQDIFHPLINSIDFQDFDYLYIDIRDISSNQNANTFTSLSSFLNSIKTTTSINIIINYNLKQLKRSNHKKRVMFPSDVMQSLLDLFELTDIYIFERKESYELFNILNVIKKDNINKTELAKNQQFNFFTECIVKKSNLLFDKKFALFIEPFTQIHLMDIRKGNKDIVFSYNSQVYPKLNHTNIKTVEEYKNEMEKDYSFYYGLLTGSLIGRFIQCERYSNLSSDYFYESAMTAIELTKKILEVKKNNYSLPPNPKFYQVFIPQEKVYTERQNNKLKNKEKKFVLDCVNTSKLNRKVTFSPNPKRPLLNKNLYTKTKTLSEVPISEEVFLKSLENMKLWNNLANKELNYSKYITLSHAKTNSTLPTLRSTNKLSVYINSSKRKKIMKRKVKVAS